MIREPGGPEVLEMGERPVPPLGGDEVKVRVRASGLNRADLIQRRGGYPAPPGVPDDVPGLEYSGTVEEVGEECRLRRPGDRVMGILSGGGYSECLVVPERTTIRVPEELGLTEAGAIPEVFLTAWDALANLGRLRSGESVLIHAIGSGVGTAALQLARVMGATTFGTSRTREKVAGALELGLDAGVVADAAGHWVEEVKRRSRGHGVDVIVDLVGATYIEWNLDVLGNRGRWVVVGVPGGAKGVIDLRQLMARRGTLHGTVLRARPEEEKTALAREFERTVVPLFERGLLKPVIDRTYPPDQAADAHRRMEANESFGKLMLVWE
jgi:NADPH:quinone reductase